MNKKHLFLSKTGCGRIRLAALIALIIAASGCSQPTNDDPPQPAAKEKPSVSKAVAVKADNAEGVRLFFQSDSAGTYYYMMLEQAEQTAARAAADPDASTIAAQEMAAAAKGSGAAVAARNYFTITNLAPEKTYTAYIVVKNDESLSEVFKQENIVPAQLPLEGDVIGWKVSGKLLDFESEDAIDDVLVTLAKDGETAHTTTSGEDGAWRFAGVLNGGYTLTIAKVGYHKTSAAVNIDHADLSYGTESLMPEAISAFTVSGNVTNAPERLGARDFSLNNDFRGAEIKLIPLANSGVVSGKVIGAKITGGSYRALVPEGAYRLEAQAENGLYDFVENKLTVSSDVSRDVTLKVFPGLKMTVRIPAGKPSFLLPVRTAIAGSLLNDAGAGVENLTIDWGDGKPPVTVTSISTTKDKQYADYEHNYEAALKGAEREFTIRVSGKCYTTSAALGKGKIGIGYPYPAPVSTSGSAADPVESAKLVSSAQRVVKLAGNITALTKDGPAAINAYAYSGAFINLPELEDIAGLAFTDTGFGANDEHFMESAFEKCAKLKAVPANFAPRGISAAGAHFLQAAFRLCTALETIGDDFLPQTPIDAAGDSFLEDTFKGCTALKTIGNRFLPRRIDTIGNNFLKGTFSEIGFTAGMRALDAIPKNFLPETINTIGDNFLFRTFMGCIALKDTPANFANFKTASGGETSAGAYFMRGIFEECIALETIAEGFLPENLTKTDDMFLFSAFSQTRIARIPPNFVPRGLKTAGKHFLSQTFGSCKKMLSPVPGDFLPRGLQSIDESFLWATFRFSGVSGIPANFLPENIKNLSEVPKGFLDNTFMSCPNIDRIPDDFLKGAIFAKVGDRFLMDTFRGTKVTAIPAGFTPQTIASVGDYFLGNTFADTEITSFTNDIIPKALTDKGGIITSKYGFLSGTFAGTKITTVPANFGAGITEVGGGLHSTFSQCGKLVTVGEGFLKDIRKVSGDEFCANVFRGCPQLKTVGNGFLASIDGEAGYKFMEYAFAETPRLEYVDLFANGGTPLNPQPVLFESGVGYRYGYMMMFAFWKAATEYGDLTLNIHSTQVLKPEQPGGYAELSDMPLALANFDDLKVYVPQSVLNAYQTSPLWVNSAKPHCISASKFKALETLGSN